MGRAFRARVFALAFLSPVEIDVGTVIAGKYELVRLLGKGAMGEVWLATHNTLGGEFAIKLVETTDDIEAETAAGRFQLEAQIAAKLSRKTRHIVSVSDHGEEDGFAYLAMELLEGESLETRLKRGVAFDLPEVVAIISQVGRALGLAHDEGIFHRDLKPANVFLTKDEDGRLCVKLLDFGIARTIKPFRTRSPFATSKDMVLGTPSYMSPEQARGLASLDYRCDLWALAVVTFEALTGQIPFEGKTVEDIFLSICTFKVIPIRSLRPGLPASVDAFFARAFAPSIEARFKSASEMCDELEHLVDPTALDAALGTHLGPGSSRRLAAMKSDPNIRSSEPSLPLVTRDQKSSDPGPIAIGEGTMRIPKSRIGGWLLAAAAMFLVIGIAGVGFVMLRKNVDVKTATAAPPPPPQETATSVVVPPPSPPEAATVATAKPATTTQAPAKPVAVRQPIATKTAPAPQPPPVVTAAPPPPPQPPPTQPPAPPAPPKKSTDKDDVF